MAVKQSHRTRRRMRNTVEKIKDASNKSFERSYPLQRGLMHWKCEYCGIRHKSIRTAKKYKHLLCSCCMTKLIGKPIAPNMFKNGVRMSEYETNLYHEMLESVGVQIKVKITKEVLEARRLNRMKIKQYIEKIKPYFK